MAEKEVPQAVIEFAKKNLNIDFHHINFVHTLDKTKVYSVIFDEFESETGFPTLILSFAKSMKIIDGPETLRYL